MANRPIKQSVPFQITPHIFDNICHGHNHLLTYPDPDGYVSVETSSGRVDFPEEKFVVDITNLGIEVHPHDPDDMHLFLPMSVISSIHTQDPSHEWYASYLDWYQEVHGMSFEEAAEMTQKAHVIRANDEAEKFMRDLMGDSDDY